MKFNRARAAFTLAELVLASAILSITALAIVGVFGALSNAYFSSETYYQSLQGGRNAMTRVQTLVRKAMLITAAEDEGLVLWASDPNGDRRINAGEIVVLEYDQDNRELIRRSIVFPAGMDAGTLAALNVTVLLADLGDVESAAELVHVSAYAESVVLATDVREFHAGALPAPPLTKLVTIEMQIGPENQQFQIRSAALRADLRDGVGVSHGKYILTLDPIDDGN